MRNTMLPWVGVAIIGIGIGIAGCSDKPSEPKETANAKPKRTTIGTASTEKAGNACRVQWSWSSATPGTAQVLLTVTPTMSGQNLRLQVRLPQGVALLGGELNRTMTTAVADAPAKVEFRISFALNTVPLIPVEVVLVGNANEQLAETFVIHDPQVLVPEPQETPGTKTNIGGFPAKVVGEAQPSKRKDDK